MSEGSKLLSSQIHLQSFSRYLWYSVCFHSLIVLFFSVRILLFPDSDLNYQSAVKVDLVDLPDKYTSEISQLDSTPSTPPTPELTSTETQANSKSQDMKNEPTVNLDKIEENKKTDLNKKIKAFEKIKKISAIERIKAQVEAEKQSAAAAQKFIKGNILSAGTSLTGINKLQHDSFKEEIDRHVKSYWNLPQWLAEKEYSSQIRVKIDQNGQIISYQIIKSSGNPAYDEIVIETVKSASPFPKPPEKFIDILSEKGIILGFPE